MLVSIVNHGTKLVDCEGLTFLAWPLLAVKHWRANFQPYQNFHKQDHWTEHYEYGDSKEIL
jgi:hypothetical protein